MEFQKPKTPEEIELEKKAAELSALESELAERELELRTVHQNVMSFEQRYLAAVGRKYAELDQLEAQLYDLYSKMYPLDEEMQEKAAELKVLAEESAQAAKDAETPAPRPQKKKPTEDIRHVYRTIAKECHPDLADDDEERQRRHAFMVRVNEMYEKGDPLALRMLQHEWESSPEFVRGQGVALDLIRMIRKLSRGRDRISQIGKEVQDIVKSEIYQLKLRAEEGEKIGRDVIAEVGVKLDEQIKETKERLIPMLNSETKSA